MVNTVLGSDPAPDFKDSTEMLTTKFLSGMPGSLQLINGLLTDGLMWFDQNFTCDGCW